MHKSLALCMIVKADDAEAKSLDRAIESVKKYVDNIYITITGKNDAVTDVCMKHDANIAHFKWVDDFAAARNFNFSQAKEDWILWLDADDTLEGDLSLLKLIDEADAKKIEGFFLKYKYAFDQNGNCIDEHWKAQLLKNNGHFKWEGEIHEDPIQQRQANWAKLEGLHRLHHDTSDHRKDKYERNLRILKRANEKNPNEPRTYFYLGRTYMALRELQLAVDALQKYLTLSGWDDERYEATLIIGQCFFQTGDYDSALQWYNSAILEKESYPEAYAQKGFIYLVKQEWAKALQNFEIALRMEKPESATFYNPMVYDRDIFIACATCQLHLGKLTNALTAIQFALKADPKNQHARELYTAITSIKKKNDNAKKFVELAKYIDNKTRVQTLLNAVPPEIQDNEFIVALRNTFAPPKKWPKKSIAIYCGTTVEAWYPGAENSKGIGGSETAVIELTKRLAKMGWDITVYNRCDCPPEGLEIDGVKYQNFHTFNINDQFDVLWVWRLPELFDYEVKANLRILDMHDVMTPAEFTKERVAKIDKIFVKTNYHRSLYPHVADEKFVVVGNGIDLERFKPKQDCPYHDYNPDCDTCNIKREPHRFIYSSSPNRGLDILLDMWPKIKEKLPEAELHVYYGWKTFYEIEKNNPERMIWMKKVQEKMKQPGVIDHGRVGQKELAQEMMKSSFWLYPTYFPEIDCITAKEMQAAGVIPITSGYAALEESQQSGLRCPGDVYEPEWQEDYVTTTTAIAQDHRRRSMEQAKALAVADTFSWDNVAQVWNEQLTQINNVQEEERRAA